MAEKYRVTGEETDFSFVKVSSNVKWFKSCNFSYYLHIIKYNGWSLIHFLMLFYLWTLCVFSVPCRGSHGHTEVDAVSLLECCFLLNL